MQTEHEQIIYHGHTPSRVWQALAQRSRETRRKIDLQCPLCSGEIHHTDTTSLLCLGCHAPVNIYQHRKLTEDADQRVIYIHVSRQRSALLTIDLRCLSCEKPLKIDETCKSTCGIQTYLVLEHADAELYIKRQAIPSDAIFPREPTAIESRTLPDTDDLTRATETQHQHTEKRPTPQPVKPPNVTQTRQNTAAQQTTPTQQASSETLPSKHASKHASHHKDVKGQVRAYFAEKDVYLAKTGELHNAIGCSRTRLSEVLLELIDDGELRQIQKGYYEKIKRM